MSDTIHLSLKLAPGDKQPQALQVARALTHYASLLIEESMGGPVISSETRLEFGATKMRISAESKDYEPQEG